MEIQIGSDARYAVIGYGSWATAIVGMLTKNKTAVEWYVRNDEVLEGLVNEGRNPKYLYELEFDREYIHPSDNIDDVVSKADVIIISVPSAFLKKFLAPLTVSLEDKFVISAIKGIIPGSWQTVAEYLHDNYRLSFRQMGIIAGPTHAEEVSRGKLSFLTLACADERNARSVGEKLASRYIHVCYSNDLYGVEYASILKNIYALSAGLAKGLGYGDNFIAVLVANCANEMTRFIEESYPDSRNTFNSAYLGDLLVTCYSSYSRNRRLGLLIGHGCTVKSALNEMTMIAEGYYAAECIRHINLKHKVKMPIADMVYEVLYLNKSPRKAMSELSAMLDVNEEVGWGAWQGQFAPLVMTMASVVMSSEVETSAPDKDSTWSDLSTASVALLGMTSATSAYIWTSSTYTVSPRQYKSPRLHANLFAFAFGLLHCSRLLCIFAAKMRTFLQQ